MTTRAEVLKTIENIELDLAATLKRPTVMQRLRFFLSHKTISSWRKNSIKIKTERKAKVKKLRTRKENLLKALSIWLDAGDIIGKYETKRETHEW
jgi:hypothetical protein